jgi:hypothetical protein
VAVGALADDARAVPWRFGAPSLRRQVTGRRWGREWAIRAQVAIRLKGCGRKSQAEPGTCFNQAGAGCLTAFRSEIRAEPQVVTLLSVYTGGFEPRQTVMRHTSRPCAAEGHGPFGR